MATPHHNINPLRVSHGSSFTEAQRPALLWGAVLIALLSISANFAMQQCSQNVLSSALNSWLQQGN
jgi:hypothetical protein